MKREKMDRLRELNKFGQSFWLNYLRRSLITSGELRLLMEEGLSGITSNPTIFQKAITGSSDYDEFFRHNLEAEFHLDVNEIYERLVLEDVQMAADILRPVYDRTDCADGFVCLELSPNLAQDTEGSIAEARRMWKSINRPNLMLKVPATPKGVPVIETLIAEGINVNASLIFSLSQYEAIAHAYIRGLERCCDKHRVASVASFFISRLDNVVDNALEAIGSTEALALRGKIAVSTGKKAFKRFKEIFDGEVWDRLVKEGARVQRILWASTSTKNPAYSDVLYIEELIGPNTVSTLTPGTLNAFKDHGIVMPTLERGLDQAKAYLKKVSELGVDLRSLAEKLQEDEVEAFAKYFNRLLMTLEEKRRSIICGQIPLITLKLGKYQCYMDKRLEYWKETNFSRRMWSRDSSLWSPKPAPEIVDRLGWLTLHEMMYEQLEGFQSFSEEVKCDGITHVILLGMGGSSLASEVYQKIFGNAKGYPELIVLDSTHPTAIRRVESTVDLSKTLFIVSSKSGTTIETLSLFKYFWKRVDQGKGDSGRHFIAITDPETPLMRLALDKGFRRIFLSPKDVGGRFSALTPFGLLPASLIGMNVHKFLDQSWIMAERCAFCVPLLEAPGQILAAAIGELAKNERDKATFLIPHSIRSFAFWIEQLIAESLGKSGKGIIPIVNEPIASSKIYGADRFFIIFTVEGDEDAGLDEFTKELEAMGHPVIKIKLSDKINLGQEIFSWEVAVAAAGAVLGIHPFNQPDVQLAQDFTKEIVEAKTLVNDKVETVSTMEPEILIEALNSLLSQAKEGNYVAIQAYLPPKPQTTEAIQRIRLKLLTSLGLATTFGYGPRFLHSTGQLHKGGPNTGLFIQLIDEPTEDIEVPEANYTFRDLIRAQALGDYQALTQRGRQVIRVNLERNISKGLQLISQKIIKKSSKEQ